MTYLSYHVKNHRISWPNRSVFLSELISIMSQNHVFYLCQNCQNKFLKKPEKHSIQWHIIMFQIRGHLKKLASDIRQNDLHLASGPHQAQFDKHWYDVSNILVASIQSVNYWCPMLPNETTSHLRHQRKVISFNTGHKIRTRSLMITTGFWLNCYLLLIYICSCSMVGGPWFGWYGMTVVKYCKTQSSDAEHFRTMMTISTVNNSYKMLYLH